METLLAVLLAATLDNSEIRPSGGTKRCAPNAKALVSEIIDSRQPLPGTNEKSRCQPAPAATAKKNAKAAGERRRVRPNARRPKRPPCAKCARVVKRKRAVAPRASQVKKATQRYERGAKDENAPHKNAKHPWIPERIFVRPPVSLGR